MGRRRRALRSPEELGLTLAVNGSPKAKAEKRIAWLRAQPAGWRDTLAEFEMYEELFPKPRRVCPQCPTPTDVTMKRFDDGGYDYECPTHGWVHEAKLLSDLGEREQVVAASIRYILGIAKKALRGKPPSSTRAWNSIERHVVRVFGYVKGRT